MTDLFTALRTPVALAEHAQVLPGFAADLADALHTAILEISATAPFRRMVTQRGHAMSVAMTSSGSAGWVSDRSGYRYTPADPETGAPWPAMPELFRKLAQAGAATSGFVDFAPDTCLINRYDPGAKMGLHQDRDEADFAQPIVSISLGLPAVFVFGGLTRTGPTRKVTLYSGDVVVWGGASRLAFHGIDALKPGTDPLCGPHRYNLTFRKAL